MISSPLFREGDYGEGVTVTGYYDPEEDRRMGETDMHTGYYYCSNR